MMRNSLVLAAVLALVVVPTACESSSSGSSRSVIDMTWRGDSGYGARYDRSRDRYRDAVQQIRNYDREYYESRVRTEDAQGRAIAPADQIQFLDKVEANVPAERVTTAGVKGKTENDSAAVFVDSDGNRVSLADFSGQPLVLIFTRGFPGYICPMCTTYTAQVTKRYDELAATGAQLLLVFPGEAGQVDDFMAAARDIAESDQAVPFPVLLDPDLKAVQSFNIRADMSLPATYIFDGNGKMRWGYVGEKPHERPNVDVIIRELRNLARGS